MYLESQKILIVHHLQEIREKIAAELKKKGYDVSVSTNGLDGLFACYYEKFALIISAIDLPKITGFEMIRTLYTRSSHDGTPTIFIGSGQESAETVKIAAKLNAMIMPLPAITSSINKVSDSAPLDDLLSLVRIDSTSR